ncbi:hypothetical protein D1007_25078 [Hordeum vulgare]|nr:hypothetical protein D1007_25078 [Hordeum vulgare]
MFQSLQRRASWALSDICGEGVSSPHVPNDAGYLGFFSRIVECLEGGVEKVCVLAQEKSDDLVERAASDMFSHLLRLDPYFDFDAVLGPVPESIHATLAEWVEDHVDDLVAGLVSEGGGESSDDGASS